VISLSQTLKGLHWDKIPGDNDDEVAARGILYLMIFQQLGQLLRWSWGFHVLLAPKDKYDDYDDEISEEGRYQDAQNREEAERLIDGVDAREGYQIEDDSHSPTTDGSEVYEPAGRTPVVSRSRTSLADSVAESESNGTTPKKRHHQHSKKHSNGSQVVETPVYGTLPSGGVDNILSFPRIHNADDAEIPGGVRGLRVRARLGMRRGKRAVIASVRRARAAAYNAMPAPVQKTLDVLQHAWLCLYAFLWEFMNPPLWAMLLAVLVASVPALQRLFFQEGSFIKNSVTSAVSQSAGVAVPLILVVLGANLARNTQKRDGQLDPEEERIGRKLLVASLLCRMVLPTVIMAPFLAFMAKYVPISILDDPIFVIVCFLLTGAPSALQLAQICQINGVYEGVMGRILFQSYVIWLVPLFYLAVTILTYLRILPSTLVLVMCALEVVEWAK